MPSNSPTPLASGMRRATCLTVLVATTFLCHPTVALPLADKPGGARGWVLADASEQAAEPAFDELTRALEQARSKLDQLTGAADLAALVASLRQQLATAEADNRALRERLAEVEKLRGELAAKEERLAGVDALEARLQEAARKATADAERLQSELAAARRDLEASEKAREAAEDRLGDMETVARSALSEAAEVGRSLVDMKEQLSEKEEALADAEQARQRAERSLAVAHAGSEDLEEELAQVRLALDERVAETERLNRRVASLESAARSARDVARANLEAVESKIVALNSLMTDMQTAAEAKPEAAETAAATQPPARRGGDLVSRELTPVRAANATESQQLAALQEARPPERQGPRSLEGVVRDLPMEKRVQAQSLLADLKAESGPDGTVMRVPGADLFDLDGEEINPSAHDTLAKVAELISLFDDHPVEITGHTDALGDASYNQGLSERRASLVRSFFVDNYDIDSARLKVSGLGERKPIATNTTRQGRQANRRVEVTIVH